MVEELANQLIAEVEEAAKKLEQLDNTQMAIKPAPGKWSKKEILGHLIDSAANNHQRFVRAHYSQNGKLFFPGYEQNEWVTIQHYQEYNWTALVSFWRNYNIHLAHVIAEMDKSKLEMLCQIGENPPVSLSFLVEDYIKHLKHHLNQIVGRC